jgi:hypothetical protein
MSLPDMLNLARGAQAYRQAEQVMPLQVEQLQAQTGLAKIQETSGAENLSKSRADRVFGIVGGVMNDPRIASGDRQKTVEAMLEVRRKAISGGVPETQVEAILSPIMATAAHNPAALPQMIKNVIQAQLGATGQQALQTPQLTTSAGAPAAFTPATGSLTPVPIQGAPQPAAGMPAAPQAAPAQAAPRVGVTPEMMTAPIPAQGAPAITPTAAPSDPGFALRYPVRPAGDIRPFARGEEPAQAAGEAARTLLLRAQADVPRANRSVGEIIRIADELEKDIGFTTGKPADLERAIRVNFGGEARYQELAKDIAQVQMALNQATGARTDQQAAQVAEGTGNATYDPKVLIKIARRLKGELGEIDARATGAQKFVQKFGDSNLPEFLQQWSSNSDLRIFESMAILRDIRDPKAQKEALDKILPKTEDELAEFQQKYRNIRKLTQTGTLQ